MGVITTGQYNAFCAVQSMHVSKLNQPWINVRVDCNYFLCLAVASITKAVVEAK